MSYSQYDIENSLILFFMRETGIKTDLVFDGYELPSERPLITVEPMPNSNEVRTKRREAIQTIYRFQIGLHASNAIERRHKQELISDLLLFERVPYYITDNSIDEPVDYFLCELTAVVPMGADELNRISEYHRVYFDVEIEDIKRGGY